MTGRGRDPSVFVAAGTAVVGAVVAGAQVARTHTVVLVLLGVAVCAGVLGARAVARRRPARATLVTDRHLAGRVAALMRAGGWRQVAVRPAMGRVGADVVGIAADGRGWLLRCHQDATALDAADVYRFTDAARYLRRGDVTVLVTAGAVPAPVREAALSAGVMLMDSARLAWWADVQRRG
ncbi:Restriction endonuclease [Asanoa hainanensis]|uniref:Restriction endonuclease n=1 Tax=Asanoa hainanensis TaxID=560556 RepID=A0A239M5Z7_9ACTN|nr:restriction endonuclease [Asanoa hainanensis]SNT37464.1 Restriction endonuclease [Asanoa hainanensis]